jgi:hypothetical protein
MQSPVLAAGTALEKTGPKPFRQTSRSLLHCRALISGANAGMAGNRSDEYSVAREQRGELNYYKSFQEPRRTSFFCHLLYIQEQG